MRAVLLCAAFVAAFAVRGDVRLVLEPLRPGEIVARGWLKGQLELSLAGMGGHLGEIEPDQMEKPYVTRDYDPANGARGVVGWCAEMGGEYAIGTAMLAYALDDPALIAKAAARVKAAMALQEPDGYLGAYRPKDNRQEDYNAWGCHWFYDAMLLEYYRTGDKAILDAVHRGLLWFVKNWSGEKKTDYAGPMIIEPASVVYRLTGDKRLLDFCEEYAAWLDRPGHKNGATFTTFPLTRHGYHVAAIAARLKVPAALAYASGKRAFLDAALKSHGDFHDGVGWQATYAPCADGEWVAAPSCVGETEYCDFIFYQQLFAWFASLTGDVGFADATERLVFNAAQGARAKDERTIGYMTSPNQWYATPNSSRWGPEPFYHAYAPNMNAACCPANSISLYPLYVLNAVSREGRDLRVMNYGPYDVRTKIDGADVRVVSETDYPFGQRVTLRVRADGWGGALRLRRPAWAERMAVTRGGKACPVAEKGGVVTVAGPWKGEEPVVVDFGWQPKVRAVRDRDFDKEPLKTVEWGALVFAQPVVEKWTRVERPKPTWGKDSAPPQPKEWPWLAISCAKEPVAYALPQGLSPADIRVERTGTVGLPWQKPPVRLVVPMLRASAAYPTENRREPGVGSKYKGTHTPIPAAGLVEPDPGAPREPVELVPFGATCLRTTCFPVALMSMGAFAAALPEAGGWSSEWIEVTAANGVKDDAYPLQVEPEKCSFTFRVTRNADNTIGVEAFVRDDQIVTDDSPAGSISCKTWRDDCLEVFFDGDGDQNPNTRGPQWDTNPTPCNAGGEYAIAANGATQSDYASAKKCFGSLWGGVAEPWNTDGRRVGTHYKLWFKWACLNRPAPRPDEAVTVRMTVCVHDDDDGGACDYALYWKGNPKYPFADERAFGTFTLR